GTYRLVYNRLAALEDDLFTHIHLENNILFPRVLAAVKA
ncbi:iron-sulfur cluster repair di-iron protein, partial [Geobacillus stearothermophilus]